MPYNIKVSTLDNRVSFEQSFSQNELNTVRGYLQSRPMYALLPATLRPIRTNNLANFSKDFFLPSVINHAIKVQNTAARIFAVLVSLVIDTLTLPIRLLTCIPQVITNARHKSSLYHYLKEKNANEVLLKADVLRVKIEWEEESKIPSREWTEADGSSYAVYSSQQHWEERNIRLVAMPIYQEWNHFLFGSSPLGARQVTIKPSGI